MAGERLDLRVSEVHVWQIELASVPATLEGCLDAEELRRADRLRPPGARERFVAAHAALRDLLGRYLGLAPSQVRLAVDARAKPRVDGASAAAPDLEFSLSHTDDLALVAIARRTVGADIECMRPGLDVLALARRALESPEVAALEGLTGTTRERAFLERWTAFEARAKCTGRGIGATRSSEERDLRVHRLDAPAGCAAAVAAPGGDWTPVVRRWRPAVPAQRE